MARKRKKSKARKKSRDDETSGGKASAPHPAEPDSSEPPAEPDSSERAAGPDSSRPAEEPEVIDLDLDEETIDEEERERLIAEMLSLDATLAEPASGEDEGRAEDDERQTPDQDGPASGSPGATHASSAAPRLSPDALAALSAIHYEGLAVLPGEFVVDLGEPSTEEERDRVLAAALARAEMQEAIYRVPADPGNSRRFKGTIASAIFLLATLVALRPPAIVTPEPGASLAAADRIHGARVTLLLQAQQIEAFRASEGRLPSSLAEVEATLPGVRFVRSSSRLYQLVAYAPTGAAIVYDSAVPDPAFAAIARPWAASGSDGS